jgi:hypothetical protein
MALVGSCYFQDTDPGAPPTGGYEWYNTATGVKKIRNLANTAWVEVGTSESVNLGLVPAGGRTMTGPLPGVTEFAPIAGPDFSGSPKALGIKLATMSDLANLRRDLMNRLGSVTSEALSGLSTMGGIKNSVAIRGGIQVCTAGSFDFTVPLPQYDGGSGETALRSEVLFHGVWPLKFEHEDRAEGIGSSYFTLNISLVNDTDMKWNIFASNMVHDYPVTIRYLVIAAR